MADLPRILLLDLETAPNIAYTWAAYETNVIEFIRERFILVCGYEWYPGKVHTMAISKEDCRDGNDLILVKRIRSLLNRADIVIAQNGDAFDIRILRTRMMIHKLPPPSPFKRIDTLKVARSQFALQKNGLNDIARQIDEGEKVKHRGFQLWIDFMKGIDKARAEMREYCAGDVTLLHRIYPRFRPWITNHPNMGIMGKQIRCPNCGSDSYQRRGTAYTKTMQYKQFSCKKCFTWFRGVRGERYAQVTNA